MLVAEQDGQLVGYLSYTWNYSIWRGNEFMNLDDLFVLKAYRGQEIGQRLMQFAKKICRDKNIDLIKWEVEKDNTKAIDFYQRLGADVSIKGIVRWDLA